MFTSLFAQEVQTILDKAGTTAGQANGPFPSPADWRDQVVYFIMVDRFNNPAAAPVHVPFDDPNFDRYQGGKFAGVQQRLGYIKRLGAGAIWLSPVLKNLPFSDGSYHGYGIHDFLRAEPRFATNPAKADDELRALVDAAHQAGLYVIFDIVLNHTGDVFAYDGNSTASFSGTPLPVQWRNAAGNAVPQFTDVATIPNPPLDAVVWPSELQQNRFYRRQGKPASGGDDTIGDFESLKQMITADSDLQRFLIRAYQYVIARYDIDGFRIDTLRYIGDLARLFGNSVREFALSVGKKNFFTFGEVLDSNTENDIARFIGRNTSTGGDVNSLVGVDAALDYPLFNSLKPTVKGFSPPSAVVGMYNFRKQTEQFILSSHGDASRFFVTFLDNHDMKERIRYVKAGDEHLYDDQVTLGIACLYALPGIPCVYYGTEQGLHGSGSDPAVREALWGIAPGFPENGFFYTELQRIATVRDAQPALRYGRFYFRPISGNSTNFGVSPFQGGVLAWSRILNDEEVLIVANTSTTPPPQEADVILEARLSAPGANLRILYSNKQNPVAPAPVRTLNTVIISEVDGSTGSGPVNTTHVKLQPMEVQILRI